MFEKDLSYMEITFFDSMTDKFMNKSMNTWKNKIISPCFNGGMFKGFKNVLIFVGESIKMWGKYF